MGRAERAASYGDRLRRVDPLSPAHVWADGYASYICGDFAKAREQLRHTVRTHPDDFVARYYLAFTLAEYGDVEAGAILSGIADEASELGMARVALALARALSGEEEAAERTLSSALLAWVRRDFELSLHVAQVYAVLRRPQDALDWLEHALELGFVNHPFLTRDRLLDSIRGTDGFEWLMDRAKREWGAFDA